MEKTRILLVEGKDDEHVIKALCQKHEIPETFEIISCEGIENLFESLPVRLKTSGIEAIGVIMDADEDINRLWNRMKSLFSNLGFTIPNRFPDTGLILHNNGQKVGVWIMPDNKANGMLEDFISFLIPEHDQLLSIVDSTLNDIEAKQLNKYATIHKSKARIHSWLAWQKDPGTPLGLSITKNFLTTDKDICRTFVEWLIKLFIT